MDEFDKAFGSTANAGKQLEVRWFFHDKDNATYKRPCHDMPFKRRNLSYIHGRKQRRKQQQQPSPKQQQQQQNPSNTKKNDLLYRCFKHRMRNDNGALMESPSPKTRARKIGTSRHEPTRHNEVHIVDTSSNIVHTSTNSSNKNPPSHGIPVKTCTSLMLDAIRTEQNGTTTSSSSGAVVSLSTGGEGELDFDIKDETRLPSRANMSPLSYSDDANPIHGQITTVLEAPTFHSDPTDSIDTGRPKTRMFFHYIHHDENGLPIAMTEGMEEGIPGYRRCPFCYFDGGSDSGILMHCVSCHGKRLSFDAARSEDGTLHMAVRRKLDTDVVDDNSRDFIFNRRGQEAPCIASVPVVQRQARNAATLDLQTRKKKIRLLQEIGAKASIVQSFMPNDTVPLRQYYHSRTNEPMLDGEWGLDSDDEEDDDWLHQMGEALLDDFIDDDVSLDEKIFMKMWNRFMKSHTLTSDIIIPQKCLDFIHTHGVEMVKLNLRSDFLLHIFNFWDSGIVPSANIIDCIKLFDKIARDMSLQNEKV